MNKIIYNVLDTLENNGYQAYIVGGFVRDYLLGKKSYDVDICTNALPKEVHKIFKINNKNNYGGSNLKIKQFNIDITTFRKDIYDENNNLKIEYINDLKEDLLRRDFTINSICMNKNGEIIDLLNGINDLNNCLIKMIGNSYEKIKEDPLRILRTIRFATVLDFEIDNELLNKIKENNYLVKNISKFRVKEEFIKIFSCLNFQKGLDLCQKLDLNKYLGLEHEEVFFSDLIGIWSQVKIANIPFTKEEKNNIIKITEVVNKGLIDEESLYDYGLYICTVAGQIMNYKLKDLNKMYHKLPIKDINEINIESIEICEILNINPSKIIKIIFKDLEKEILRRHLKNNKKDIKNYLKNNKDKWLN